MKGNQKNSDAGKLLSGKHFAYKAIFVSDGLIFLFEEVRPFTEEDVKINAYNGDLFLELGNNVVLFTEQILKHLIKTKNLFLYKSPFPDFQAENQIISLKAEPEILARIQGAWEVAKKTQRRRRVTKD